LAARRIAAPQPLSKVEARTSIATEIDPGKLASETLKETPVTYNGIEVQTPFSPRHDWACFDTRFEILATVPASAVEKRELSTD
jgi:hypothetical protein